MPRFQTVVFDCDSTLSAIEGIEELAKLAGANVRELTEAAMSGAVALEVVYGRRLEMVRPNQEQLEVIGRRYIEAIIPGAVEVVGGLRAAGIEVLILSGGLKPAVLHLTRHLGLPDEAVEAVDVYFDSAGRYAGFDQHSPLARSGGKLQLLAPDARRPTPDARRPLMLVGDGATDLEAASVVDSFVAFAGIARRPAVIAGARIVIAQPSLSLILPLALGEEWRPSAS